jgi:adenylate kinase family enzyme
MKFTTPEDFLHQNYGNLHTTPEVEKAVERGETPTEQKPRKKIKTYLDRIENALEHKPGLTQKILEKFIIDDFVLDTNDEELILRISKGLYESEKRVAIERGQTNQIQQLEQKDKELLNRYREVIIEKAEIQRKTIKSWIDYLKSEDANYPLWFKYFVFRSLKQMGSLERDDVAYGRRTETTIAPFPELNSEALGFVRKAIEDNLKKEEYITDENPRQEELLKELDKRLQGKNFAKLYAFAQIECAGNLDRESLQGKWVTYKQGSDYTLLEEGLKGKGTGWCIAEGSAKGQIENGDFYVYYTNNKAGVPKEPRIAIRMQNNNGTQEIAEIRGVNKRQGLEPELADKAKEFYQNLPGAERYEKADRDMNMMTEIYNKSFTVKKETKEKTYLNPELSKEELEFLYEVNDEIQSFGYDKDPRIEEIRNRRNTLDDKCVIFECKKEQIATNIQEVDENTKAYIGPWNIEVYNKIKDFPNMTLYEWFPGNKIFTYELKTDSSIQSSKQMKEKLEAKGIQKTKYTDDLLDRTEYSKESKIYKLVQFKPRQLGFPQGATIDQIYAKAEELGLKLCPAEVGPQLRLSYSGKDLKFIAMKQISPLNFHPCFFFLSPSGLYPHGIPRSNNYGPDHEFVFLAS